MDWNKTKALVFILRDKHKCFLRDRILCFLQREGMEKMELFDLKKIIFDILVDMIGGFSVAVGIYNFATNANFPLAGVSGLSLIFYRLFGVPIGFMTILLNIPIVLICFRFLGKRFFLRGRALCVAHNFHLPLCRKLYRYDQVTERKRT